MNVIRLWWTRVCEPLDGFLWHKDISHPVIRPVVRNGILAGGLCLMAGVCCYVAFPRLFWFAMGLCCMTWIFWSWAKFFLKMPLSGFSMAFVRAVLLQFGLRLVILAILLYVALAYFSASAGAILAGVATGSILALASFAANMRKTV